MDENREWMANQVEDEVSYDHIVHDEVPSTTSSLGYGNAQDLIVRYSKLTCVIQHLTYLG